MMEKRASTRFARETLSALKRTPEISAVSTPKSLKRLASIHDAHSGYFGGQTNSIGYNVGEVLTNLRRYNHPIHTTGDDIRKLREAGRAQGPNWPVHSIGDRLAGYRREKAHLLRPVSPPVATYDAVLADRKAPATLLTDRANRGTFVNIEGEEKRYHADVLDRYRKKAKRNSEPYTLEEHVRQHRARNPITDATTPADVRRMAFQNNDKRLRENSFYTDRFKDFMGTGN